MLLRVITWEIDAFEEQVPTRLTTSPYHPNDGRKCVFKARASDQAITTCEANTPNPLLKRRSNIRKPAQVNKCIPAVTSCIAQGLLLPLKGLEGLVGPMGPAP